MCQFAIQKCRVHRIVGIEKNAAPNWRWPLPTLRAADMFAWCTQSSCSNWKPSKEQDGVPCMISYTRKQQPAIGNLSNRSLHCASRILHRCRNLMCRRMACMHGEGSAGDEFCGKHVHSIKQPTLCLNLFSIVQPLVPFCVFFLMRCMRAGCSCGEPSALFWAAHTTMSVGI